MHHPLRAHDVAAVELADALMPEAHTEHRHSRSPKCRIGVVREAGVFRPTRSGRDEHRVGPERHISSSVTASWRCTNGSAPSSPRYCTRL